MSPYKNLISHKEFLKSLAKAKTTPKRRLLLALANSKQVKALKEITHNVIKRNVPLTSCQIRSLIKGKYRKPIKEAGNPKGTINKARQIFIQKGGFLQYILPAALSFLASHL
jgi:hypothetical protein